MRITVSTALLACALSTADAFVPSTRTATLVRPIQMPSTKVASWPLASSASAEAVPEPEREKASSSGGTATVSQEIFNLVKAIVGAGVLSLPAGIAAFGNAPSAVIPAIGLIAFIGGLSAYGFGLTGRVCSLTKTTTYRSAWSESINPKSSWIPAWTVTFKTFCAILAYSMILGDTFRTLVGTFTGQYFSTWVVLPALTTGLLLPLCLLKNLSSLAPFSLLGSIGMVYTALAMFWRYITKAYSATGKFGADMPTALQPAFGNIGASGIFDPKAAILLGMLSTAYMAHFNAPKFYVELKDNTVPRFMTVVGTSFGISVALFAAMAGVGFLTFGGHSSGLILSNYSPRDALMSISRIAVFLSLVFSYPLAFVGFRDGVLDLLKIKERKPALITSLTLGLLSFVTFMALVIPDVSFVLSFAGATLGNALVYVFPALMFRGAVKKLPSPTKLQKTEVKAAMGSALFGIVMGALGAVKAVQAIL